MPDRSCQHPGQLGTIAKSPQNGIPADENLIFDADLDHKYERVLALMGISPAMLSSEAGHA